MSEKIYKVFIYSVVSVVMVISAYPLFYIIGASLMTQSEWAATNGVFFFPKNPTLMAYEALLRQPALYSALRISVLRAVIGSVTSVFFCLIAGYTVSRKDLFGKKFILLFIVITMIYGGGLIPTYMVMDMTGLVDTFWVFIIPGVIGGWTVLVFKQTFENMPSEIEEAALIDGSGYWKMLWRIHLPINIPTLLVLLLFGMVGQWNSWFDALIYIIEKHELTPLQLYLMNALTVNDPGLLSFVSSEAVNMATAVIGIVPIMCVYPFIQKHFTKGVYTGAVKG